MSKAGISEAQSSRAGLAMLQQAASGRRLEFVQAILNRAAGLMRSGQIDSADVLLESVEAEPLARAKVLHMRAVVALQRGEDERALDLLEESIQLDPADGEAHANLGTLLLKARQHAQALAAFAAALTLRPDNVPAQFGVAQAFANLGFVDFAEDAFRDLLAAAPDAVEPVVDFAALLNEEGQTDEAIALLRAALAQHAQREDLHTMLFVCLLARGEWSAAWRESEWRLSDSQLSRHLLATDRPRWQGEDLAGKTILLQAEQGYGDTLQFVRYAPLVKARGARVVLRAPAALQPLLRTVSGVDEWVQPDQAVPPFDVHAPLLSLPGVFDTQPETVPADIPYIEPDGALVAKWTDRLGAHAGCSIGLVWQGNPAHAQDWRRSIRLDLLQPLLDCPGARFISLQIGPGERQVDAFAGRIVNPADDIDTSSFADVAAIIANLDLVIAIDSAIAHLAGAMGKPVWILLANANDWRWLRNRDDTPWYPHAVLFRQKAVGDWEDVVARLRRRLWSFAGADNVSRPEQAADPVAAAAFRMAAPLRASEPVVCDGLFVEACRQHRFGRLDRAKALYEKVLAIDPAHINTLCNLGALQLALGDAVRAYTLLQQAVIQAPALAPARTALADVLLATQKTEQAVAQYQKAIELAPASAEAHAAYAAALSRLDELAGPTSVQAESRIALIHQHFRKALELAPTSDAIHARYAMALRALADLDGAMAQFLAATRMNQHQSPDFYEALGRTCAERGNAQGAEVSLKHAIALDARRVSAHCALGALYAELGRSADASAAYRAALAFDDGNQDARNGLRRLSC